jgi:hypothetical protein
MLDRNDAVTIKDVQDNIIIPGLENNLTYIKSNFTKLTLAIEQLQRQHAFIGFTKNSSRYSKII